MNRAIVLGFSLVMVAGFCLGATFIVTEWRGMIAYRMGFVWGWGIASVVVGLVWLLRRGAARAESAPEKEPAPFAEVDGQGPLRSAGYWAILMAVFAIMSLWIQPVERFRVSVRARQAATPPPKVKNEPPLAPGRAGDPFAEIKRLRLQGVLLDGQHSNIILNGDTYTLGDTLHGARISLIRAVGVDFVKDGKTFSLQFER